MEIYKSLNIATAIFSLMAAILWLTSSLLRFSTTQGISMLDMYKTMRYQSKISAWAAICATIAALAQSVIFFYC